MLKTIRLSPFMWGSGHGDAFHIRLRRLPAVFLLSQLSLLFGAQTDVDDKEDGTEGDDNHL